ncbi:MAG: excisionase family DNA-binding protein [Verrucomicrobiaceae bacterium]
MEAQKRTQEARHFTVAKFAERIVAHPVTCRRWIREGRIKVLRLGRLVRITAEEVERFEKEGASL